ncbi:hypothetical protein [Marinobacter mangrovi]|uniref:hypothetical protein n=1 Tax=Marinobacter mangrovi TaxID=2803918 RepID=UPI00193324A8|nr:hypothetical protein [Marinobacter mangrovi]
MISEFVQCGVLTLLAIPEIRRTNPVNTCWQVAIGWFAKEGMGNPEQSRCAGAQGV